MNRRNFIGGAIATGFAAAVPVKANSSPKNAKSTKVVHLRGDYYTIDGWVISKDELMRLKETGYVD